MRKIAKCHSYNSQLVYVICYKQVRRRRWRTKLFDFLNKIYKYTKKIVRIMTMNYNFQKDMKAIREILGMTQEEFAEKIGVEQATISRNELGKNLPSSQLMERVYQFAFDKKIQINQLKKMLWAENLASDHKLLFHGAKSEIAGEIDVTIGRTNNDFGCGF